MPKEIDWGFWSFTAMFSACCIFKHTSIPGLDGGHALFTTWELITGKPVPQKVLENTNDWSNLLMGLMLLIFGRYLQIISPIFKIILNFSKNILKIKKRIIFAPLKTNRVAFLAQSVRASDC